MSSSTVKSVSRQLILAAFVLVLVLAIDQILKYWVKTNMTIGEEIPMMGDWFKLHFTENCGMAFGMRPGGDYGKLPLTIFRILAAFGIGYYLVRMVIKGTSNIAVICFALILAGALGNIIDSVFYGWLFTESTGYMLAVVDTANGYAPWFKGCVVDMLYFPMIKGHYPDWLFGGRAFEFFRPIFNIADASISVGVAALFIFQRSVFVKASEEDESDESDTKLEEGESHENGNQSEEDPIQYSSEPEEDQKEDRDEDPDKS